MRPSSSGVPPAGRVEARRGSRRRRLPVALGGEAPEAGAGQPAVGQAGLGAQVREEVARVGELPHMAGMKVARRPLGRQQQAVEAGSQPRPAPRPRPRPAAAPAARGPRPRSRRPAAPRRRAGRSAGPRWPRRGRSARIPSPERRPRLERADAPAQLAVAWCRLTKQARGASSQPSPAGWRGRAAEEAGHGGARQAGRHPGPVVVARLARLLGCRGVADRRLARRPARRTAARLGEREGAVPDHPFGRRRCRRSSAGRAGRPTGRGARPRPAAAQRGPPAGLVPLRAGRRRAPAPGWRSVRRRPARCRRRGSGRGRSRSPPASRRRTQRARSTLGHVARARRGRHQRHQRERAQHRLQEGELDLQRVLALVGRRARVTCGSASARAAPAASTGTRPSGVRKASASGRASPASGHVVGRAEEHHPLDPRPRGEEARVGAGGDRARVDVAGVGTTSALGRAAPRAGHSASSRATSSRSAAGSRG